VTIEVSEYVKIEVSESALIVVSDCMTEAYMQRGLIYSD
jgi:hypothetical protein